MSTPINLTLNLKLNSSQSLMFSKRIIQLAIFNLAKYYPISLNEIIIDRGSMILYLIIFKKEEELLTADWVGRINNWLQNQIYPKLEKTI